VTKLREESAVIQEVAPEDLGSAEEEVAMGNGLEDFLTKPLPEFHYSLLMTRWAEVAAFA